jgi:hypothetical protein
LFWSLGYLALRWLLQIVLLRPRPERSRSWRSSFFGGLVFVDESAEQVATMRVSSRMERDCVPAVRW